MFLSRIDYIYNATEHETKRNQLFKRSVTYKNLFHIIIRLKNICFKKR
ncbi:hypothetical protein VHARVF571_190055 [Vibrio harveyi]|nr:hypothetical protein VHARVF571_190055 [Vibrio harveyi]